MKKVINEIKIRVPASSINEGVARAAISSFVSVLDPSVEELCDLRCAVSEAVTNSVVHAYRECESEKGRYVYITAKIYEMREVCIEVVDKGCGIENVERARAPMFTTGPREERCGMGFLVMESFTDSLEVYSRVGKGTRVVMRKKLK